MVSSKLTFWRTQRSCLNTYGTVPSPRQASGRSREWGGHHRHSTRFCHCTARSNTSLDCEDSSTAGSPCFWQTCYSHSSYAKTYNAFWDTHWIAHEREVSGYCITVSSSTERKNRNKEKKINYWEIAKPLQTVNCGKHFLDSASTSWYRRPNSTWFFYLNYSW